MRFLVIDNEGRDVARIQRLLESSFRGATLAVTADPHAYKDVLAGNPPDAVLTENQLDWTDGFAVLRDVQQHWPGVPVIMVTGSGSEALAVSAMKSGFADYVAKDDLEHLPRALGDNLLPKGETDRLLAALDKSAASLIHAFPDGVVLCNREGRVVAMNSVAERVLGYSAMSRTQPLTGLLRRVLAHRKNGDLLGDEDKLPHRCALRGETPSDILLSWLPSGYDARRWYSTRAAPIFSPQGQTVAALCTFTDVTTLVERGEVADKTAQARAEALESLASELEEQTTELEAQNEELNSLRVSLEKTIEERTALLDVLPLGITVSNSEGRIVEVNQESERLLGLTVDEHRSRYINDPAWEIVRPDGTPLPAEEYAGSRALRDQTVVRNVEMGVRRPDGEIVWLDVSAAPLRDRRVVIAYVDITDRKRAEAAVQALNATLEARVAERTAALLESEERFRALVTATSYVIYRMSPDWTEMRELDGRGFLKDTDEPSAGWVLEYILPEDQPHVLSVIAEAIRTKSIFELEHRVRGADGTVGWTYSRAVPLLNERGEIVEWFGAASDITDRKRAEVAVQALNTTLEVRVAERTAELETLNETNTILLQEVNHRVKNTLTAILGLILTEKRLLEKEASDGTETMRGQSALSSLFERVQSLATVHGMLSSGQWRPLRVDVLVDEIVRESLPYYVAKDSGCMLLDVTGEHVYVTPEQAHHLALIIGELTTNAVKHGWRGSRLHISVDVALVDGDVRIVYRNDGPEYPEHVLNKEGHSVGLSIVNGIATHSLRGSWAICNDGGPVTEIRFPVDLEQCRGVSDEL